jgi:hypothetical protein
VEERAEGLRVGLVRGAGVERADEEVGNVGEQLKERTEGVSLVVADLEEESYGDEAGLERVFVCSEVGEVVELSADLLCLSEHLVPGRVLAGHVEETLVCERFEEALEVAVDKVLVGEVVDEDDEASADVDGGLVHGEEAGLVVGDRGSGEGRVVELHRGRVARLGERGEVALGAAKVGLDGSVDVDVGLGEVRHAGTGRGSAELLQCVSS